MDNAGGNRRLVMPEDSRQGFARAGLCKAIDPSIFEYRLSPIVLALAFRDVHPAVWQGGPHRWARGARLQLRGYV